VLLAFDFYPKWFSSIVISFVYFKWYSLWVTIYQKTERK